jgi:hypothetical protein
MRRTLLLFLISASLASPTLALEITNLDQVDHRVRFEAAGTREEIAIPVNRTIHIAGQPNGKLTLLTAPKAKKSRGAVQADGILANVFAGARTENLPVDSADAFVIWPGADIRLQQRRRGGQSNAR